MVSHFSENGNFFSQIYLRTNLKDIANYGKKYCQTVLINENYIKSFWEAKENQIFDKQKGSHLVKTVIFVLSLTRILVTALTES